MTWVPHCDVDHVRCAVVILDNLFDSWEAVHPWPQVEGHHKHHEVTQEDQESAVEPAAAKRDPGNGFWEKPTMQQLHNDLHINSVKYFNITAVINYIMSLYISTLLFSTSVNICQQFENDYTTLVVHILSCVWDSQLPQETRMK